MVTLLTSSTSQPAQLNSCEPEARGLTDFGQSSSLLMFIKHATKFTYHMNKKTGRVDILLIYEDVFAE